MVRYGTIVNSYYLSKSNFHAFSAQRSGFHALAKRTITILCTNHIVNSGTNAINTFILELNFLKMLAVFVRLE